MKKLLLLLALSHSLFAMYMGNPSLPDIIEEGFFFSEENWFSVKTGYQRDWVFDREMKGVSSVPGRMDDFEINSDQGVLTFNILNHVEVYGSAGAARIFSRHRPMTSTSNVYETHDQLIWGAGVRALFANWGNASFGGSISYERTHPRLKWATKNGVPISLQSGAKMTYNEWQVGVGAAYQVGLFSPYCAIKYSNACGQFHHLPKGLLSNTQHFKVKNSRKFGLALGTTLSNGSRFSTSVEARFIDEQSITLVANVKL